MFDWTIGWRCLPRRAKLEPSASELPNPPRIIRVAQKNSGCTIIRDPIVKLKKTKLLKIKMFNVLISNTKDACDKIVKLP